MLSRRLCLSPRRVLFQLTRVVALWCHNKVLSVSYTHLDVYKRQDKDGSTLVLERGSNDPSSAAYRDRTMTLDGKVIAKGAVSQGDRTDDDIRNGNKKGTETYLLPWIWDSQTGEKVKSEDEKLYHWNCLLYTSRCV